MRCVGGVDFVVVLFVLNWCFVLKGIGYGEELVSIVL